MSEKKQTAKAKKNDDLIEVEEEENTFAFSNMGGNNEDEISVTKPGVLERERRSRGTQESLAVESASEDHFDIE